MKKKIKIYTVEHFDNKTKQTWYFQKGLSINSTEDKVVYGDIKWYVKREILDNLLGEKKGGLFEVNISKVLTKEITTKNNEKILVHTFEINDIKPLSSDDDFDNKLSTILDKTNQEHMQQVFK